METLNKQETTMKEEKEEAKISDWEEVIERVYIDDEDDKQSRLMKEYEKRPGIVDAVAQARRQATANNVVIADLHTFREKHPTVNLELKDKIELREILDRAARIDFGFINEEWLGNIKYSWKVAPEGFEREIAKINDVLFIMENGRLPETPFQFDKNHTSRLQELSSAQMSEEQKREMKNRLRRTIVKLEEEKQRVIELAREKNPPGQQGEELESNFRAMLEELTRSRAEIRRLSESYTEQYNIGK